MSDFEQLLPDGWKQPVGYANGIAGPASGRPVFIAGMVGWTAEEKFETRDMAEQFGQAVRNILAVLAEAGGKPEHICRMTAYCTDKPAYLTARKALGPIWRDLMGDHYPAMALVFVDALLEDEALIEIEATAVIPAGGE